MRRIKNKIFLFLAYAVTALTLTLPLILLAHIFWEGWNTFTLDFIRGLPSRFPEKSGIKTALAGSLWLLFLTGLFSVPVGVATALCIEEYGKHNRFMKLLELNISNLAGVPSIIYGMLGLTVFVRFFGMGESLLAGALTLALLVLPVIVIAAQGAIGAVPRSIRLAAYGLGARKWQVTLFQVLPAAFPGILTGVILSLSRAIGETAPLIIVGAVSYIAFTPESVMDSYTALPVVIYNWASRPQEGFHQIAASGIIVLLGALFIFNLLAIIIRNKYQRYRL
jgi:phosphate transport system permease protein